MSEPMKCEITGKETMIGLPLTVSVRWGDSVLLDRKLEVVSPTGMLRATHYFALGIKPPSRKNERVKKPREERKAV